MPAGTRVTWLPATANGREPSVDRAEQRAVERRMPICDVSRRRRVRRRVPPRHVRVSRRRGPLRRPPGSTGRRPHNVRISQISCDRATQVVLRSRINRETPFTARPTRSGLHGMPGNGRRPKQATIARVRRVDSRLPKCRMGSNGTATAATRTTPRREPPIHGIDVLHVVTTTLTVQTS